MKIPQSKTTVIITIAAACAHFFNGFVQIISNKNQ